MRSDGVEVAEKHNGKLRVGMSRILKDIFDHELCFAVRVGAVSDRHILGYRHGGRVTVNRCGRAEDYFVAPVLLHCLKQGEGGIEVVSGNRNW